MLSIITNILPDILLWLILIGMFFFLWATKKNRLLRLYGLFFVLFIWLLGTRPAAEIMLRPLEKQYEAPSIESLKEKGISEVVVLTGGGFPVRGELLSATFPHGSIYRFLGGLELCAQLGTDCHLIFSGSAGRSQRDLAIAEIMKNLVLTLEPKRRVSAESLSGSTGEHPLNVKKLLGDEGFILVTSAYHMPRAMKSFRKAGLKPVAYPVDSMIQGNYSWNDWLPSAESLWKVQVGFREYIALVFYMVKGW
jgi:uncharacterized SAM-binding protein YcdF (DUF218 family)